MKREEWMSNRDAAKRPRLGWGCCACDRSLLSPGHKCPECGWINGKKKGYRRKKDTDA